jgi:hypothetical protein
MRKTDTKSIAYLFKEMDPSEEVEFERSLKSNENLLIEVESFRQTNERLQPLPSLCSFQGLQLALFPPESPSYAAIEK